MRLMRWAGVLILGSLAGGMGGAQEMAKPHPGGHVHQLGTPSTTLTVTIDGKAKEFKMAELEALPQEDVTVFDKKAKRNMVWSGPSLATVFAACGMPFSPETEHDVLHHYVVATGTDGYSVVSSAGELIESFSGVSSLVAIRRDGQPLGSIGQFALFNNQDKMPARHVSNLTTLDVRMAAR